MDRNAIDREAIRLREGNWQYFDDAGYATHALLGWNDAPDRERDFWRNLARQSLKSGG